MTTNKKSETGLKYNKVQKMNKNFMYQDLKRSNCYNSDFSNYNFTSLRGAQGLTLLSEKIDKDFCTLSYIIKSLKSYDSQGIL